MDVSVIRMEGWRTKHGRPAGSVDEADGRYGRKEEHVRVREQRDNANGNGKGRRSRRRRTDRTHPVVPNRNRVGLPPEADLEVWVVTDKRPRVSGHSFGGREGFGLKFRPQVQQTSEHRGS